MRKSGVSRRPRKVCDSGVRGAAHSRAYTVLKEAVLAGTFVAGEVVTLRSLAERLSASEMPVREALRRLTSEGAFEALPNRSARVPSPDRRQVGQILELRAYLEGRAVALAAGNMSLVQIDYLRQLQHDIDHCIETGDPRAHTAINRAFHFEIVRSADNPVLTPLIETLWLRSAPFIPNTVNLLAGRPSLCRRLGGSHHARLIQALQARDPVGAEEAMQHDILGLSTLPGFWESLDRGAAHVNRHASHRRPQTPDRY